MIELPMELPSDKKEEAIRKYFGILEELENLAEGEGGYGSPEIARYNEEPEEFLRQVAEVCGQLRAGGSPWQGKLADLADLFSELVEQGRFRGRAATEHAGRCAKAGLAYLVAEFDAISDHIPVLGYVDDVLVLNLAAGELKDDDQELYDLIKLELQ